jgi:hypothetical protein
VPTLQRLLLGFEINVCPFDDPQAPFCPNDAVTVQLPVIAPVVYVLPDNEPLHPLTETMLYPVLGVTVKAVVEPLLTVCAVEGLMLPPEPADGVTV